MKETTEKKVCGLCGKEIEKKKKGLQKVAYEEELRSGAHRVCREIYAEVLKKHQISNANFLQAFIRGITELFPEINETKEIKAYKKRVRDAHEEIAELFPNVKAGVVAAEDTKEKEKEKEEEGSDELDTGVADNEVKEGQV